MKTKSLILAIFLTITASSFSQKWTQAQLDRANTAGSVKYLTQVEKEAIMYINLCRLFPKQFFEFELKEYQLDEAFGDSVIQEFKQYKKSLKDDLLTRKACNTLKFDSVLFRDAKCYSTEISKVDRNGHDRVECPENEYAECISFGSKTGRDIALQLLVDSGIESLGHRKICLDKSYSRIGISSNKHFHYEVCAVAEFL